MKTVKLQEIAKFLNGYAFKPSDWQGTGRKIIRIQNLTNASKEFNRTKTDIPAKYRVQKGDILVSWSATLDIFEWNDDEDAWLNQHIFKVEHNGGLIDKYYLKYALKQTLYELERYSHGSTMKHVVRSDFLNHKIPLASLPEQKQIVQILDTADSLRQKRKEQLKLLDDYLKSVFLEMFGDPVRNDKKWDKNKLGDISAKITDGTHKTPKYKSKGVNFISAKNVTKQGINWENIKYISTEEHAYLHKRCNPEKGDVVLTKSGSIGLAAIVDVDFEFSMFESLALVKHDRNKINANFLKAYLNADCKDWLYGSISKGISIRHLHLIDIKCLKVFLPPIDLQNKFASIVEQIEQTKQKMRASLDEMDNHFNALMQNYFG